MSLNIPIQNFYKRHVKNLKPVGDGQLKGLCPLHEDKNPSLSINLETGSWFCHACVIGGGPSDFTEQLGVEPPDDGKRDRPEATYNYCDEDGSLLFQVVRFRGKQFRQRRPDGSGGWVWDLKGVRRILYHLPDLKGQRTAYVTEGEKDCDNLWAIGIPATTSSGGAGKWRHELTDQLNAAGVEQVVILPDNDDEGRRHAEQVAQSCLKVDLQVKIVELPDLPPKGDVSEWLDKGHTKDDIIALVVETLEYEPQPEETTAKTKDKALTLNRGTLVEQVYDPETGTHGFLFMDDGKFVHVPIYKMGGKQYEPLMRTMVEKGVILLPSGVEPYEGESGLASDVQAFIHKYVDVDPYFENLSTWFALFTWVYDVFSVTPYLRALGDYGTGKTRHLKVVGSICYRAIFAGGATTVSPLFRILDVVKGTLIIDEGDFKDSQAHVDFIKILNQGHEKGSPVWRSEPVGSSKKWEPTAYEVFGPKVIATRHPFQDKGLESRCLTKRFTGEPPRADIPLILPESFWDEALALRNKLLAWRFEKRDKFGTVNEATYRIPGIEPRLNQILMPLLSIIEDQDLKDEIKAMARTKQDEILEARSTSWAAWVLKAILELAKEGIKNSKMGDISKKVKELATNDGESLELTARKVGHIVGDELILEKKKRKGVYHLVWDDHKIDALKGRYGLSEED